MPRSWSPITSLAKLAASARIGHASEKCSQRMLPSKTDTSLSGVHHGNDDVEAPETQAQILSTFNLTRSPFYNCDGPTSAGSVCTVLLPSRAAPDRDTMTDIDSLAVCVFRSIWSRMRSARRWEPMRDKDKAKAQQCSSLVRWSRKFHLVACVECGLGRTRSPRVTWLSHLRFSWS